MIRLYAKDGSLRLEIAPSSGDRCTSRLMGESTLTLSCILPSYVEVQVGDYADYEGTRYYVLEAYQPEMISTLQYRYALRLSDSSGLLRHTKVIKPAQETPELDFALDARPAEHIRLIVDNANRITGTSDWTVGTVIQGESRNIEYRNKYCLEALGEIAKAYDTEWWIEGRTINLSRCEHGQPITLGYRNGLSSGITRLPNSTAKHFTRLYPLGSRRNIIPSQYGHSRLQLPGGKGYLERNTHLGIIEQSEEGAFAHIYPRYTGTVTAVRHEQRTSEDGKPYPVYYVKDSGLPFSPSTYQIQGLTLHLVWQSGELNGRDFEANWHASSQEWEIIAQRPYDNQVIPSGLLIPKVGDKYIPYNMRMPQEYITRAEQELQTEATKWIEKISQDTSVYKAHTDYIHLEEHSIHLNLGRRVTLQDAQLFARSGGLHASRITSISRSVLLPTDMDLEMTYTVDIGRIAQLEGGMQDLKAAYQETQATLPTILKSWDSTDPSEYNVLSALRTLSTLYRTALRKDQDDYTAHAIGSAERVEGLLGWLIRPNGDAYMRNLKIAGALEVDELRKNRITILDGEHYFSSGTAVVAEVGTNGGTYFRPRLEEGETSSLQVGDACLGKWVTASGVQVCKLRVYLIDSEGNHWYNLEGGSAEPRVGMHLAQVGSNRDSRRQRATLVRNNVIIQYDGLTGWDIEPQHITGVLGNLDDMSLEPWGRLYGSGAVLRNAYISGQLSIQSSDGRSEQRLPYPKGEWRHSIAYPYDQYEYDGHLWLWTGSGATSSYPSVDNGWQDLGQTPDAIDESLSYLRRALSDSTDIQGGLILSTILALRDQEGKVSAYLNGRASGTDPMLALGVQDAFLGSERRAFWADKLGRVYMGQMQARSSDGSLLCYTGDRDFAPYLILGGGATNIRDLLNANPNKYGYITYERSMTWRGMGQSVTGSGRGGYAQYISNPIVARKSSMRITGRIKMSAGTRINSSSGISLSVQVSLFKGDWSRVVDSYLIETGWLTQPKTIRHTMSIDTTISGLDIGASYSLRVECVASSRGGMTRADVDILRFEADGDLIPSAEAISIGEHGLSVMYGLDRILMLHPRSQDGDTFLDLYGKTNMPGVLAAGRVNRDGRVLAAWGAKVNKQGVSDAVVDFNSDNTYTVHHSVGHTDYIPQLTVEDSRDVIGYFQIQPYSFKVRVTFSGESGSAYPNAFSYVIFGDNR